MVKREEELWIKRLKESLEDYSEPHPASGWQKIQRDLPQTVGKSRIYSSPYWTIAAVVALLVIGFVSAYLLSNSNDVLRDQVDKSSEIAREVIPDVLKGNSLSLKDVIDLPHSKIAKVKTIRSVYPTVNIQGITASESILLNDSADITVKGENSTSKEENVNESVVVSSSKQGRYINKRRSAKDKFNLLVAKTAERKKKWSVGLSLANASELLSNVSSASSDLKQGLELSNIQTGLVEVPEDQMILFKNGVPYLEYRIENIKHHQPIAFALSLRKKLFDNFSVETGLVYTMLSSDVKQTTSSSVLEQKIHYIGIPLRANWHFLDESRVALYLMLGGMVEKAVYAKLGSKKLDVNPLQCSLLGGVGAQFNMTKNVGLYAEPGVAYFFDDGSNIETIRKKSPLNFNMQIGLRFSY
ncbi:hypothetical protein [uncultured Bacteroides sp.]|uniref:hypothetical protein n=1 Tax=uncultured Bacteroides sp. TaxID=162156 RepID=UPI002AAB801B|nr:hypothetical protein [uncultured Bacteroides sp.]